VVRSSCTLSDLPIADEKMSHTDGDIWRNNKWFSAYFSPQPARYRMVICPGQAQIPSSWYNFAQVLKRHGFDVFVQRIPGQFDRSDEDAYIDFNVLVKDMCLSIKELGILDDDVPLAIFGYSLGTAFAYDCTQYLQHIMHYKVAHVVSLCGLTFESICKFKRFDDGTVSGVKATLKKQMECNFGRAPSGLIQFLNEGASEAIDEVSKYFLQGLQYVDCWTVQFGASQRKLNCNFLWVIGSDDPTTTDNGWRDVVSPEFLYECIGFPGDHFFSVENAEAEAALAHECARSLYRKIGIYDMPM